MLSCVFFRASAFVLSAAALAGRVFSSSLRRLDSFSSTSVSLPGMCLSMCDWCVSRRFLVFPILALRPVIWLVTHKPSTFEQPNACALPCTSVRESICTPTFPYES